MFSSEAALGVGVQGLVSHAERLKFQIVHGPLGLTTSRTPPLTGEVLGMGLMDSGVVGFKPSPELMQVAVKRGFNRHEIPRIL
jgi:hypothetical protein